MFNKGCKWSHCAIGKKLYVVKNYVTEHSCLLKARNNKRVTSNMVMRRFGHIISSMPFISPINLKVMVRRELEVLLQEKYVEMLRVWC